MISVPVGTGDICFAYDIPFGGDIRLRRMMERILYHIATKEQYIIRRKSYIISRSDISLTETPTGFIITPRVISMSDNKLLDLSFEFAVAIVNLIDGVTAPKSSYMIDQLARAGTSVGANIHEAQYAHSKKDFIAKLEIALKEANETNYWLKLMFETRRINEESYRNTERLCGNIRRLLIASCRTAKENQQ